MRIYQLNKAMLIILIMCFSACNSQNEKIKQYKYPNGQIQYEYTLFNGEYHGPSLAFYENGEIWSKSNYVNGRLEGDVYTFTPRGDTAVHEVYSTTFDNGYPKANDNSSLLVSKVVYWQEVPDRQRKFLFVSNEGFQVTKDGRRVIYDTAPDNLMEEKLGKQNDLIHYIWKNSKKKVYDPDLIETDIESNNDISFFDYYYPLEKDTVIYVYSLTSNGETEKDFKRIISLSNVKGKIESFDDKNKVYNTESFNYQNDVIIVEKKRGKTDKLCGENREEYPMNYEQPIKTNTCYIDLTGIKTVNEFVMKFSKETKFELEGKKVDAIEFNFEGKAEIMNENTVMLRAKQSGSLIYAKGIGLVQKKAKLNGKTNDSKLVAIISLDQLGQYLDN